MHSQLSRSFFIFQANISRNGAKHSLFFSIRGKQWWLGVERKTHRKRKVAPSFFCTLSFTQEYRGWVEIWGGGFEETMANLFFASLKRGTSISQAMLSRLYNRSSKSQLATRRIINWAIYILFSLSGSRRYHDLCTNDHHFLSMTEKRITWHFRIASWITFRFRFRNRVWGILYLFYLS